MTETSLIAATGDYLARHFVSAEQLGAPAGVSEAEVWTLVEGGQLPQPSYEVREGHLVSVAFGELDGAGLADGSYFHSGMRHWLARALEVAGQAAPNAILKSTFLAEAEQAQAELAAAGWLAPECADADGRLDAAATAAWLEDIWQSHLEGIFGVCVRQPDRIDQIVLKETMQGILSARTENGTRTDYSIEEASQLRDMVQRYAVACADFTPVEYPISSRHRFLEGLSLG